MRNRIAVLSLGLAACSADITSADTLNPAVGDTNAPTRLPEKVVTATRTEEPIDQTAVSVTLITGQELQDKKVTSLVQALEAVPGLTLLQSGTPGQATSVFIRGNESNHTLLVVDGRRQSPNLFGGYDFANLSLDNVERIEVVRTGSSALYGGDAIGGVINIVTKSGRGLMNPEHSVSFEGGSFQTHRPSVSSRGDLGALDYSVEASYLDATYPRRNNSYQLGSLRTTLGYELNDEWYLDLKAAHYDSFGGSPGGFPFTDPKADLRRRVSSFSPGATWTVNDTVTSKAYYAFDRQYQRYTDSFGTDNRQTFDSHQLDWQTDVQVLENWKVSGGVGVQELSIGQVNAADSKDIDAHQGSVGGFLQSQLNFWERLSLLNSVRFDRYTDYDNAVSWRQGLWYRIPKSETLVFGSVSRSYSPPTPGDLYFPGFSNPLLDSETAVGWEVGVEQPFLEEKVKISATYFRNELEDLIQFVAVSPVNVAEATTEGLESALTLEPCKMFSARLSYTYLTAMDEGTDTRLLRRPRHQIGLTAALRPTDRVTLSAGATVVVDREDAVFDFTTFSTVRVEGDDYVILRAAVAWEIDDHWQVWLRGENLSDVNYEEAKGFPALPLGAYAGVRFKF